MRYATCLCLVLCCLALRPLAQQQLPDSTQDRLLEIYQQQYADLLTSNTISRGISLTEHLEAARRNPYQAASIRLFANALGQLYPKDKGIAIVFYFFSQDTLYRLFFTPGQLVEQTMLPIRREAIEAIGQQIQFALQLPGSTAKRTPRLRGVKPKPSRAQHIRPLDSVLQEATALLLPPAFDSSYRHLIIVPALNIGTLPFQLLQPYGNGQYLADRCSHSVAPGLTDLLSIRAMLLQHTYGWLTYDPNYNGKVRISIDSALFVSDPVYPEQGAYFFPPLPGAAREVAAARPYADHYVHLEKGSASRSNVLAALRHCDFAYFATHGMASDRNPMDSSFLVLSGERDPYLTARDVIRLRDSLHAGDRYANRFPQITVLSACQTGLGEAREAGVTGLARSFLVAGSNQVIMSLWSVDDEATAYMMGRFLYYLAQPQPFSPAEPLRLAALDTRARFGHPAQWASFSVFGVTY